MTVLKWLLIVVALGYLGGLAALFFKQRAMLFPIPTVGADDAGRRRLSARPKSTC